MTTTMVASRLAAVVLAGTVPTVPSSWPKPTSSISCGRTWTPRTRGPHDVMDGCSRATREGNSAPSRSVGKSVSQLVRNVRSQQTKKRWRQTVIKKWFVCTAMAVVMGMISVSTVSAQTFGPGAKLFIQEMDGGLKGFLVAELTKKKVPVTVVLDEASAEFVMTGAGSERKTSWHEGWLSTKNDVASGSVMIFSKADKSLVWAEEAGDRSLLWGSLARGGQRKVASRIADRLKDHFKKNKS
jgi:hypothetical protein